MGMPGKLQTENNINFYRYGFQGLEKSAEIKGVGNSYTADFWEYDPRLGRRWNVDPVTKAYEGSYTVLANNPISLIDPKGTDTLRVLGGKNNSKLDIIYGKGTGVHTFDLAKISYLPNLDIGKNTVDLTGLEDPDLIGLDLSGGANLK
jgi:RHS repeat-associated protein